MKMIRYFIIFLILFRAVILPAAEKTNIHTDEKKTEPSAQRKWSKYYPYVPERKELQLELGGMWEEKSLYWLAGTFGFHMGRCFFADVENCQQFLDFTGGAGSRDSLTDGLAFVSYRVQHLSFPKPFSPSWRVLAGGMNIRDDNRDRLVGAYGLGAGMTATLHPKLDVKFEVRAGYADRFWGQSLVSFSFKVDKVVDDFTDHLQKFGSSAVRSTGDVIQSTLAAPKSFLEWFNREE